MINNYLLQLLVSTDIRVRLLRHSLLWSTALLLIYRGFNFLSTTILDPSTNVSIRYSLMSTAIFGGLTMAAYLILTSLIRRYVLLNFKMEKFLLGVVLVHVITSILVFFHFHIFTHILSLNKLPRFYSKYYNYMIQLHFWQAPLDGVIVWFFSFSLFYNYLLYAVGFKAFKDLFTLRLRQTELEKENLRLEFDFLKSQLNPHFLFNTLNNIYSFSFKSPNKVASTILKLADLMRYSLYETEEELVLISKELKFLSNYIDLERIRHEENVQIMLEIKGDSGNYLIPPLLLVVFVENAFKHGIQASAKASWVRISINILGDTLLLQIDNSKPLQNTQSSGGIGLPNVHKRLDYYYPNRHKLTIQDKSSVFSVTLKIDIYETFVPHNHSR